MATIDYSETQVRVQLPADRTVHVVTWTPFSATDTGQAYELPASADRSIQFSGTFGSSTMVLEGSLDGTNYETLTDPQGNAISKTATGIEQIMEVTRYIRPRCTVASGATITATLLVRR